MSLDREAQLIDFITALAKLISILQEDSACKWTNHFRKCLAESKRLTRYGFVQTDLNKLSNSVISVYGGTGSFSDYTPIIPSSKLNESHSWQPSASFKKLDQTASEVFEKALALREIEK
jgi:hypothetical protein